MPAFVYILRCADGSYYVGRTQTSLDQRIAEHQTGRFSGYTARRRPVELAWHQEFQTFTDANATERKIKGWSRAKKEALISGDHERLKALSRRRS